MDEPRVVSAGVTLKFRAAGDRVVGYVVPEDHEPGPGDEELLSVHRRALEEAGIDASEAMYHLGEMLIKAVLEAALGVEVVSMERRGPGAQS